METIWNDDAGVVMIGISVVVAILRFLTTQPLSEKGAGGGV